MYDICPDPETPSVNVMRIDVTQNAFPPFFLNSFITFYLFTFED